MHRGKTARDCNGRSCDCRANRERPSNHDFEKSNAGLPARPQADEGEPADARLSSWDPYVAPGPAPRAGARPKIFFQDFQMGKRLAKAVNWFRRWANK